MGKTIALKFVLTAAFAFCCSICLADGMMVNKTITDRIVETPSPISSQRAVIKWKDGMETMIVESTVKGPKGVYGWVVPLPSMPSFVKPVNSNYVSRSFAEMMRPATTRITQKDPGFIAMALVVSTLWLTCGYRYRKRQLGDRVLFFVLETAASILFFAILFPVFASSAESTKKGLSFEDAATSESVFRSDKAKIIDLGTIGSYDVKVVTGKDSDGIIDWFREHNYQVPNLAKPAIEQYIKEDWVFLAAEVRKDRDEPWPIHPLKAVFPSAKPVYPMRLTGTQKEPLRLELLVIADGTASVDGLGGWLSHDQGLTIPVQLSMGLEKEALSEWHDGLYAMAKFGTVATYLRGDLDPDQMKSDFDIEIKPFEPFRVDVWTREAADSKMHDLFVNFATFGAFLAGIFGIWKSEWLIQTIAVGGVAALLSGYVAVWQFQCRIVILDAVEGPNLGRNWTMDSEYQPTRPELQSLPTISRPK